ncbi:MAG: hypothetical protein QM680_01590 [Luteolibacter sp.]
MKPESQENPTEDGCGTVPPEFLAALRRLRQIPAVSAEVDHAVLSAAKTHFPAGTKKRPPVWWCLPFAAAACFLLAWLILRPAVPVTPASARQEDAAAVILREVTALYPNQVIAITRNTRGLQLTLADQPNVVAGKPLALKICEPHGCEEIITFSGQRIEIAGHTVQVRTENNGRVILDGDRFFWSNDPHEAASPGLHIESRTL